MGEISLSDLLSIIAIILSLFATIVSSFLSYLRYKDAKEKTELAKLEYEIKKNEKIDQQLITRIEMTNKKQELLEIILARAKIYPTDDGPNLAKQHSSFLQWIELENFALTSKLAEYLAYLVQNSRPRGFRINDYHIKWKKEVIKILSDPKKYLRNRKG